MTKLKKYKFGNREKIIKLCFLSYGILIENEHFPKSENSVPVFCICLHKELIYHSAIYYAYRKVNIQWKNAPTKMKKKTKRNPLKQKKLSQKQEKEKAKAKKKTQTKN